MPKFREIKRVGTSKYLSGKRTDTQVLRKRYTKDGSTYYERKDYSLFPKYETLSICRSIKRLIQITQRYNNYPNVDELLFCMLMDRTEARSFPKYRVDRARKDILLKCEARSRAIQKGRYFPSEHRKSRDNEEINQDVERMRLSEQSRKRFSRA